MADTINQCLLSQTDFNFIAQANLVTELTNNLSSAMDLFSRGIIMCSLTGVSILLLLVFAFMLRRTHKKSSNLLIVIVIIAGALLFSMLHSASTNVKEIKAQLHEAKTELKTMEKSDVEIFDACHHPDAILKLAPNRDEPDFESSYKPVVSVE